MNPMQSPNVGPAGKDFGNRDRAFSGTVNSLVECVGIDGLRHVFQPHKQFTECGVKIKRKKLGKTDFARHSCYECTY